VVVRSKAWTVFARSNAGIVGSNPTQGMDVCLPLFYVCVVLCIGSGLATGWSPVQGVLLNVYRIKKLKKRPRSNKRTVQSWEREREGSSVTSFTKFSWKSSSCFKGSYRRHTDGTDRPARRLPINLQAYFRCKKSFNSALVFLTCLRLAVILCFSLVTDCRGQGLRSN
jgi:hypothetical protein